MRTIIFAAMVIGLSVLCLMDSNAQNADVNGDGAVNVLDLTLVGSHYGERVDRSSIDVNGDGIVDVRDLVIVANAMSRDSADTSPATGGTLIFGRGGDSLTLDPALALDGESVKVCDMLYDTLIQYREDTTDLEPALSGSVGELC